MAKNTRKDTSYTTLRSGARVAIIGGGPAGSFFVLFAKHYARLFDLDVDVTIFEPRDFDNPGAGGCNMCAGLIPMRDLRALTHIGIEVPERVIRSRIHHYTLHTAAGRISIPQPDPDGDVISVYRGQGPRDAQPRPGLISFDSFLLETARSRGVAVVPEQVTSIALRPHVAVTTPGGVFPADLAVLAAGVNRRSVHFSDMTYRPPPREHMVQTEFCPGADAVRAALEDSVHIFLPEDGSLTFGTLVPKGACINVSLLGSELPADSLERFLALPEITALLPEGSPQLCGCRPHIAVGPARPLYADGFVAVGDAGITRFYKNSIGTALRTARRAAEAFVRHGTCTANFRRHYGPLCRKIAHDNRAGRLLFAFTGIFQHHAYLIKAQLRSIEAEQILPPDQRLHSRLLWGMFTGTYPYRQLLAMALRPTLYSRLLRHLV